MIDTLILAEKGSDNGQELSEAQVRLRNLVLNSVSSPLSRRSYEFAINDLYRFAASRPLSREVFLEYRASLENLSASTINVRLSAVRKLVHEARRAGYLSADEASNLTDVPNVPQRGQRLGNWLTKRQAKDLLKAPDQEMLIGKRDYCVLCVLIGCALRSEELVSADVKDVQERESRWVFADLVGKGGRVRTVAIPHWVKNAIDQWMTAGNITSGRLIRGISKRGEITPSLSDWSVWNIVTGYTEKLGYENLGPHDLRRTCAKLCRKSGGDLEQIKFLLGHSSIQTTERYLGVEQDVAVAVNDNLGF